MPFGLGLPLLVPRVSGGPPAWSPLIEAGCFLWLRGDLGVTISSGVSVASWADQSGNTNDYIGGSGTALFEPTLAAAGLGGKDAIAFDPGSFQFMTGPTYGIADAEMFVVFQLAADPPSGAEGAIWHMGAYGGALVPYSDGLVYDDAFSTLRKDGIATSTGGAFATPGIYSVVSTATEWTNFINGVQLSTTGTNTVAVEAAGTLLGATNTIGGGATPSSFGRGKIAEVIGYDHKLSSSTRADAIAYLKARYGIS